MTLREAASRAPEQRECRRVNSARFRRRGSPGAARRADLAPAQTSRGGYSERFPQICTRTNESSLA